MEKVKQFALDMMKFIDESPSVYHVVENAKALLEKNGFKELDICSKWNIELGKKYYVKKTNSTILAFTHQIN